MKLGIEAIENFRHDTSIIGFRVTAVKRDIIPKLQCPNRRGGGLSAVAVDESGGDIVAGVLICHEAQTAYPIEHGIAVLLSDEDTDREHHSALLAKLRSRCPASCHETIDATLARLAARTEETPAGIWNREEMAYYDARDELIHNPEQSPLRNGDWRLDWSRLVPRQEILFRRIAPNIKNQTLIEIGCGTAKTVATAMNPDAFAYSYTGIEVSWQRLLHARAIMPGGNFIQGSAMNMPLAPGSADIALAFGAFHHMTDPLAAVSECGRVVRKGGFIGFHEPVHTPKLVPEALRGAVESALQDYQHSEHDNDIDYAAVKALLAEHGFETVAEDYSASVVSLALSKLRMLPGIGHTRALAAAIRIVDSAWIQTAGRLSERLGPRGVLNLSKSG